MYTVAQSAALLAEWNAPQPELGYEKGYFVEPAAYAQATEALTTIANIREKAVEVESEPEWDWVPVWLDYVAMGHIQGGLFLT